jgi:MtN3 and saliva related transmembrane protein
MIFLENFFGTLALITSIIGLIPQIYKSAKTRSTFDVSMIMLINYLTCSICWIIYGLYQGSSFVVWSNIVGCVTSLISIIQKYYYDKYSIV